uniref:Uncharacterized protein n=1 Tax=Arundo donax TaxID=35708 RepID=A0A0A8Z0F9_ARUDO
MLAGAWCPRAAGMGGISRPWRVVGAGAGTGISSHVRIYSAPIRGRGERCHL